MPTLHIIEPTLNNTAGHCFTVVHALAKAAHESMPELEVHVWAGHRFCPSDLTDTHACVHPHFHRKIRRLQLWNVLRRLTDTNHQVLLPTAGRSELAVYAMLPKRNREQANVWFYLHQLRMDGARAKRLAMLATRLPQAHILCTHPALQYIMQQAGFSDAKLQPCPFEPPQQTFSSHRFKQLIFPGEARVDKNLPFIAKLIEYMHHQQSTIPVMIQAGPNHHGVFSQEISQLLQQIRDIGYPYLSMPQCMMGGEEYLQQFSGGICLQPYRTDDYASKISGITLDALTRGCPCITQQGTWPADVVAEFSAGVTCEKQQIEPWLAAVKQVIDDYPSYQEGCAKAMQVLNHRHHPLRTLETIMGEAT